MTKKNRAFWGMLEYKPRWTLTWRGWCLLLGAIAGLWAIGVAIVQPFLAVSQPIEAKVLVVEGWGNDEFLVGAYAEFKRKPYQLLITTGQPLTQGSYLSQYKTYAQLAAATLVALGLDPDRVVAVPSPKTAVNRTVASAVAVKDWLAKSQVSGNAVNLFSFDVHTRRSWLLFQRVFSPEIAVGAIAHPSPDYDARRWWTSSEGVRSVMSEAIAYVYAAVFRSDR